MKDERLKNLVPAFAVFAISFAVYLYTLCPTVYWEDAGELIAACYTLGIPHPPGHPLYTLLGKLFTLIPVGSPAYRVNLMSAFFGALSCAVMFQVVNELVRQEEEVRRFARFAGVIAALGTAFSLIMWNQSLLAETTTMHSFFMLIVTLLLFRIDSDGPDDDRLTRRLLVFSFIYGLSFTNHVAGLFFAPSIAFVLIYRLRLRIFRPGRLAAMLGLSVLGLFVYAYLPIASRFDPPVDWGNPESFYNFWWVVSARQYSANLVRSPSSLTILGGIRNVLGTFASNLSVFGCALALWGATKLWKKRKQVVIYGLIITLILFVTSLNSAFISVYLLPAVLMLAIWAGFGVAWLCSAAERMAASRKGPAGGILARSGHVAAVLLVFFLFLTHFFESNMRDYVYARDYGVELLSSLPENAVLITGTAEPLFIGWYLQYCEDFRTDVKIITRNGLIRPGYLNKIRRQYPELDIPEEFEYKSDAGVRPEHMNERGRGLPWFVNSYFIELYERNSPEFPIFWEGLESNQMLLDRFAPHYLVFRILPEGMDPASYDSQIPDADEIAERIGHDLAAGRVYGNHMFNFGVYSQRHNDLGAAERFYEDSLTLYPTDTRALNNTGTLLAQRGDLDGAFERFQKAFRARPDDATSNHNVGQVLLDRGQPEKAIPYFLRAAESDPPSFEDYHNLGLCYGAVGKNGRAVTMFRKALGLRPEASETLSSLGVTFLRMDDMESARKALERAVELEPANAENWYNIACLEALEGDRSGAAESLDRALKLNYQRVYDLASDDPRISSLLESVLEGGGESPPT